MDNPNIGQLVQELIELVKNTAPQLWQMAHQKVLAEQITNGVLSVVLLIFLVVMIMLTFLSYRKLNGKTVAFKDEELYGVLLILSPIFGLLALGGLAGVFISFTNRMVAGDYYALMSLIDLVK